MEQRAFSYQVMVYMNDLVRGEPVNIGVILWSSLFAKEGFKGGIFLTEEEIKRKCYQIVSAPDLLVLGIIIKKIQRQLSEPSNEFLDLMKKSPRADSKIQFTEPKGLLSEHPQMRLKWLFNEYVALPPVGNSTCR